MGGRFLLVGVCAIVFTLDWAGPALAHGGGTADATNFRSNVDRVVVGDGSNDAEPMDVPGVTWRIRALDSYLEVTNETAQELVVTGYEGEPYLRITRDRVLVNRNSPALYLNNDRFAETSVPAGVGPDAEPDWVEEGSGPTYRWHDHRVHWMAQTLPPQAKTDPSTAHIIQNWSVPFTLNGEQFATLGTLRWVPASPWWPVLLAALAAVLVPFIVGLLRSGGQSTGRTLVRTSAAVVAVIAVLDVVHAVDDVLAVPATVGENLYALAQSAGFIAIGMFGAVRGWRGGDGSVVALAIGAAALFVGIGLTHTSSLTSSQIATVMPPILTRFIVAANLVLAVPVAATLSLEVRRQVPDTIDGTAVETADEPA